MTSARADEGMWLVDDLPKELLDERYDFVPSDEWAKHIMLVIGAFFVRRVGVVCIEQRPGAHEPSRGGRHAA